MPKPGGAAVLNRDNPQFDRLQQSARHAGVARIVTFGEHATADARLLKLSLQSDCSTVQARILGADVTYKLGAPGRHVVMNSLAVLAAASLAGAIGKVFLPRISDATWSFIYVAFGWVAALVLVASFCRCHCDGRLWR